ncbi:MAG TPA: hypothetical protein VGC49_09150 [Solirubrobacterales bacterium]|jgi:carbamate kinase
MEAGRACAKLSIMRILAILSGKQIELAAVGLAALVGEHELVVSPDDGSRTGSLAVALSNAMPGRDVVIVLPQIVVSPDDPALAAPSVRGDSTCAEPQAVAELRSLRVLIESGALVVCAVSGGVAVTVDDGGRMRGVEAVIDKDLTAALLARRLDVDLLLMLTDVEAVHLDSIGPKADAACRFVEATGRRAAVGALEDAARIVRGEAGTQIEAHLAAVAGV